MQRQICLFLTVIFFLEYSFCQEIGTFWQLTDIHYDANYSDDQTSPIKCHRTTSPDGSTHGQYGDYDCDSPWTLVVSAINTMKRIEPNSDFILWTGDSVPHVPDSTLNPPKVFSLIQNVTAKLSEVFSPVPIFPAIGNHDSWPANQVPVRPDSYYDNILYSCGWETLLGADSQETFRKGGYYTVKTPSGQTVITLNTVIYYTEDLAAANLTDPAIQFLWLEQQLSEAQARGEKVYIVAHVPPGTMARALMNWFYPSFNERFLGLLQQYSDSILAGIFGHEHTDSFRLVYSQGAPSVAMFLAPAVTPWKSSIPGIGANNPSLRLYSFDKATGRITDYQQFFLNISAANIMGTADWTLEYRATEAYGIDDVSAGSLGELVEKFREKDSDLFRKYFEYNSVLYDATTQCDGSCKVQHICSITNSSYPIYKKCVKTHGMFTESSHFPADMMHHGLHPGSTIPVRRGDDTPTYMYFVITGVITLLSVVVLTATVLCCRRRHVSAYFSQPQYMPINT